ncbi:MAG: hypothetical protein FH749_11225 [Firmicutes bacterium]|nr:hypothetical protein [Bacillota bacterium]
MNFAALDNIAVNHHCWLQRCSLPAKALLAALTIYLVLSSLVLEFLLGVALLLLAVVVVNRLPLVTVLALVLFPMFFASIFAVSLGDWQLGLVLVLRAGSAALTVLLVFLTTPPVRVLGLLAAPMPKIFGELLYFTYRALFLLWETVDRLLRAVRLRGGFGGGLLFRWRTAARVYGAMIARAFDLAQRQYQLLNLRGLGTGLKVSRDWRLRRADISLLPLAALLIAWWLYV